jgi:hypothetical protein
MRAALANAKLPFGMGDGMRLFGAYAESRSAVLVVEGSDAGSGVTEIPLSFGVLEMGEGEPGVAVERSMAMHVLACSFMGDSIPPDSPWVLTLWKRVAGATRFYEVATFDVETTE